VKTHKFPPTSLVLFLAVIVACTLSPSIAIDIPTVIAPTEIVPTTIVLPTLTATEVTATEMVPVTGHLMKPSDSLPASAKIADDVISTETGAPYGDSYKLNRFERPFLQGMTYVADLDITQFSIGEDADWYYVSLQLAGSNPNNAMEIHYGAEIDLNADGAGDYIIWTRPPYTTKWSTSTVQIFQDTNGDTGGSSALEADANSNGNGYDGLIFDGSSTDNSDPDLAWVRLSADQPGMVQIAFKKLLTGPAMMLGVVSDAGLGDVSKYDYADHIAEADAGSPVKNNKHFPLGFLYAVDNTCWDAIGFPTTGNEPKLCQPILQTVNTQKPEETSTPLACSPPPDCGGGPYNPETCQCE
jgi:hypothetical protein